MKRFSLSVLLRVVLLVGAVIGLYVDRSPWILEARTYTEAEYKELVPKEWFKREDLYLTPDKTRRYTSFEEYGQPTLYGFRDEQTNEWLFNFKLPGTRSDGFIDDDTFKLSSGEPALGTEFKFYFLRRRFPEWWWGIFYRPYLWVAVLLILSFAWDLLRKTRSVPVQ